VHFSRGRGVWVPRSGKSRTGVLLVGIFCTSLSQDTVESLATDFVVATQQRDGLQMEFWIGTYVLSCEIWV
jgi:hypothetical protein